MEATSEWPSWFLTHSVDLVFNIAEGTHGAYRESHVPAILEALGIPFTGSGSVTLALALDKAKTKQLLAYEGIPTPAWQLCPTVDIPLNPSLRFPLIVKPNREGSAKGILKESVVWDAPALRRQLQRVCDQYRQAALVEEFIDGTELTVGVLGNETLEALPILEIDFSNCQKSGEFFYSWRMKEYQGDEVLGLTPTFHCPARLTREQTRRVQAVAMRAHRALGCCDLSRTDIRFRDGVPYVLEVNPLPGLDPTESNLTQMTKAAGIPYALVLHRIVELALARYQQTYASRGGEGRPAAQTQEPSARLHAVSAAITAEQSQPGSLAGSPTAP